MRDAFPAYRRRTSEEFRQLWQECVFAFDASVLLDLYSVAEGTREQFLGILDKIATRIWLPHQVATEFYDNRSGIISRGRTEMQKLADVAADAPNYVRAEAAKKIREILEEEQKHLRDFLDDDPIESRLAVLFKGRIGEPFPNRHQKYIEAEQRFELKIPPGYLDQRKDDYRRYGDVMVWFQLMDHAAEVRKHLVLVTGDSKADWWLLGESKKRLGARPELGQEMMARAGVQFHLYSLDEFLKHAKDYVVPESEPTELAKAVEEVQILEQEKIVSQARDEALSHVVHRLISTPSLDSAISKLLLESQDAQRAWRAQWDTDAFHKALLEAQEVQRTREEEWRKQICVASELWEQEQHSGGIFGFLRRPDSDRLHCTADTDAMRADASKPKSQEATTQTEGKQDSGTGQNDKDE